MLIQIGFAMNTWIDEGWLNGGGARVHPEYQNMGVTRPLYGYLHEKTIERYGSSLIGVYGEQAINERSERLWAKHAHQIHRKWVST